MDCHSHGIVESRQKLCPGPLHQFLEFIIGEKAPDPLVIQSVRVLPLERIIAHRFDKFLPILLRQEPELMEALC